MGAQVGRRSSQARHIEEMERQDTNHVVVPQPHDPGRVEAWNG